MRPDENHERQNNRPLFNPPKHVRSVTGRVEPVKPEAAYAAYDESTSILRAFFPMVAGSELPSACVANM
jgi:hypothetical protein